MILQIILGVVALILAILLLVNDKNKKVASAFSMITGKLDMNQGTSQRLFSTLKGFLLILCLVVIFATLVQFFG